MFAYCGNNPAMGYDPTGEINWGNVIKAAALVIAVTAVVAVTVATAGAIAVTAGVVSTSVAVAATTGAVVGGLAAGISEVLAQSYTKGTDNLNYGSIAIETFVGSAHGAIDGVSATNASAGGRLACKGGKVLLSAVGSISHSINKRKNSKETKGAVAGSVCASLALQGGMAGLDYFSGKMNTTMLEQNLLDGAMVYGVTQSAITGAIRVFSNIFRNRNDIIEKVF